MNRYESQATSAALSVPILGIPSSKETVTVKAINSTAWLKSTNLSRFVTPHYEGHDLLYGPAISYLVEHEQGGKTRRLVFDLGVRKDWENLAPRVKELLSDGTWKIHTEKNVAEILGDGGVSPSSIEGIIWSHWHFDHTGDPSTFPSSTDLIVGPHFKEAFLPGWPVNENGVILESDYKGRNLRELNFDGDDTISVGQYKAIDYFADGSFYILEAPGHTIDHLCALARTSVNPPTFILMGGDTCHHVGELRPSSYLPLPDQLEPSPINPRDGGAWPRPTDVFPGSLFVDMHRKKSRIEPFYTLPETEGPDQVCWNRELAHQSLHKMQQFDADESVFVCIAHDPALLDIIDFFPLALNSWKEKGWATKARWKFLNDFAKGLGGAASEYCQTI